MLFACYKFRTMIPGPLDDVAYPEMELAARLQDSGEDNSGSAVGKR